MKKKVENMAMGVLHVKRLARKVNVILSVLIKHHGGGNASLNNN